MMVTVRCPHLRQPWHLVQCRQDLTEYNFTPDSAKIQNNCSTSFAPLLVVASSSMPTRPYSVQLHTKTCSIKRIPPMPASNSMFNSTKLCSALFAPIHGTCFSIIQNTTTHISASSFTAHFTACYVPLNGRTTHKSVLVQCILYTCLLNEHSNAHFSV